MSYILIPHKKLPEKQTADEVVLAYNKMALNWSITMCTVDRVVLSLLAVLGDLEVSDLIEKMRSKEADNSKRVFAFMQTLNTSPYGDGFEIFIRNAIEQVQDDRPASERVVALYRAELAFIAGWEKAAISN